MIAIKDFGRSVLRAKRLSSVGRIGKRAVLLTVPISVLFGLILATIPIKVANAVVPNLKWIDSATIEVSGGDLQGTYKIVDKASKNPGVAWYGQVDVTHKDGCQLGFAAQVDEGKNGKETDWSKVHLWVMAPDSGKNCYTDGPHQGNDRAIYYGMGVDSGGSTLYTVANVDARGKQGEQQPDPVVDDPEDQQVIKVALYPGWSTVYTTPNPSSPPKADELVPQEDLWVLCGNANDPPKSWDPYRGNLGTPDYEQMDKDCLARKNGWVIASTRGPIQTQSKDPKIKYEGQFTGVKWGDYVVCDFITNSCQDVHKEPKKVLTVDNWKGNANPLAKVPGAETDTDGTVNEPELACDVTFDLTTIFSLKWLVCPVINAATSAVGVLEDVINNLLKVDTKDIFNDSDANNAYHKAWNSFRAFALGLIVIAALVMVVSQAAGVEILDAYTVRKVLPRLLFASIFIALSWDILEFLTNLSNDAGTGIRTLIYAPFQALNKNNDLGGGSSFVLALIGTGGALAFGWIGLLSFALTGLLAALVAFAVLVFRKMLILLLLMMAPFAIACYVLPNTQKGWEIWKGGLLSALIVFPIISAFIAIGRVFSITAFNSPGIQTVNQIIAVIAYFAPYFLISMAFRLAGGFIATVGGVVNDRSRGAFDRLKGFRGNKVNENMSKMAAGRRFQNSNPLARGFNAATGGVGTYAKSNSKIGFLFNKDTRSAAFAQQRALNAMAYGKSDNAMVAAENDPLLRAQTYASAAEARRRMASDFNMSASDVEGAISAANANGGFGRDQQINAARRLFSTGTGYDNLRQVQETVARVAGSNREMASDILGFGNSETGKVGRLDLKTGYNRQMKMYDKGQQQGGLSNADLEEGYMDAIKGNEALQMLRGKPIAVKNVMPVLTKALATAQRESVSADGEARSLMAIANDTSRSDAERADAANRATVAARRAADNGQEAGRLTSIIDQFQQSAQMYASAANTQTVYQATEGQQAVVDIRQNVKQEGSNVTLARDARTGQLRPVEEVITDPVTGDTRRVAQLRDEGEVNIHYQRGLEEQAPRQPNDPRNSGLL
jgi:hypothetical protein